MAHEWMRRPDTAIKQGEFYILTLSTLLYPAKHFIRYASLIMLISKHFIPKPDTLSHLFLKMVIHTEPIKAFINKEILM
jgi:hypothetical protein